MRIICFCIPLLFCVCCGRTSHNPNADTVRAAPCEVVKGISMYDTIGPPKLITDSTNLYKRVGDLLKFSSRLKYEEETRLAGYVFIVETDGHVEKANAPGVENPYIADDISADMKPIFDFVIMNIAKWEPAFMKNGPSKKVSYLVHMNFYFEKDEILFLVEGPQSYYFLRKSYDPNYAEVD